MSYFRAVRIQPSKTTGVGGWAVERTTLGEKGGNVGPIYSSREEAKAEAAKLRTLELQKTGKPHS